MATVATTTDPEEPLRLQHDGAKNFANALSHREEEYVSEGEEDFASEDDDEDDDEVVEAAPPAKQSKTAPRETIDLSHVQFRHS